MKPLKPSHRELLMERLANVAFSVGRLREAVDIVLLEGAAPAAVMVYSQIEWAAIGPAAYAEYANDCLQRIMADLAHRAALREEDWPGLEGKEHYP